MDIQTPFIFLSLFSLASVLLIFIYKFGIKEKSYEEALAEQRHQTHILLGTKPKSKEKKNKKTTKKVKEKSMGESEVVNNPEKSEPATSESNGEGQKKPHVEFKEVPEEVSVKNVAVKKQAKKEKVRPILMHKEKVDSEIGKFVSEDNILPLNHFEELHPKDDFELFRSNGVKEKEETEKNPAAKSSKTEADVQKQPAKKSAEAVLPTQQKENNPPVAPSINGFIGNAGKEKKKKKSEFNTLQQLAGDGNGPNMSVLLNLVRKAELSRSEVQILIDLLLNKQHEAPAVLDEWSEGKSDPVQKLKKQLAEKEKLLLEEQQVVAGAQTKLREIRAEHQAEKTMLQQKIRNLDEVCHAKQVEANRLLQQVQQLQAQIKEEMMKSHKLREEHAAMQMQRQQIDMRLAQAQESDVLISQLQNEAQELSTINNQLRMELTRLDEENCAEKDRNQSFIVQLNNFQKELEQTTDRNQQLEESRLEAEQELETVLNERSDLKSELSHLNSVLQQQNEEIRRLEHGKKQYQDELQKHKEESSKLITQLKSDIQTLQEENMQIQATQMNGSLQENKHEVEILNLHNELSSMKTQLSQAEKKNEAELKAANATVAKLQSELGELKVKLEEEKTRLEEQKVKNNELRTKNWKVMEALNAAESRIKSNTADKDIHREFIQRLFPEIKELESTNSDIDCEKYIKKYIDDLRKQNTRDSDDVYQLKSQLQHYKNVIDNTEKMLNKLQKHIEQEEINWRMQLAAKTAELESLKESYSQEVGAKRCNIAMTPIQFQEKLTQLETELRDEQEEKQRIITQFQEFKNSSQNELQKLPEVCVLPYV
ncbi:ribosome-binding protein 1-like [Asbolus verrucosus]|uniref:Ribosome-binding protein 1-like n=1 Tax=Asbolus verrucosus TaxID=1661398 RepID=A0A482V9V7_ASBVE|nr:ribosome-binding protein 1-like [Asbolus verrucosus]